MIPQVLHYCWFGDAEPSLQARACMLSWEAHMPDFEIVVWTEENFDLAISDYSRTAYERRRWAHLSDYVQAWVLREHGGIVLDTDMLVHRSLTPLLSHGAFSGFEKPGYPFTAIWGAERRHSWPAAAVAYMEGLPIGEVAEETNTRWMTRLLTAEFSIDPRFDTFQIGRDDVAIYPSETLCLGSHVGFSSHLFSGSWTDISGAEYRANLDQRADAAALLQLHAPDTLIQLEQVISGRDGGAAMEVIQRGRRTFDL